MLHLFAYEVPKILSNSDALFSILDLERFVENEGF